MKNRIHALLAAENLATRGTDLFGVGGRTWLAAITLPGPSRAEIEVTLRLIASLDAQIAGYDQLVRRWARAIPEARLLQTVSGTPRSRHGHMSSRSCWRILGPGAYFHP